MDENCSNFQGQQLLAVCDTHIQGLGFCTRNLVPVCLALGDDLKESCAWAPGDGGRKAAMRLPSPQGSERQERSVGKVVS
jgi:hypothetical protein